MNWDDRAHLGDRAGTDDLIAKELSVRFILSQVKDGMKILDAGCGNGVTAARVTREFKDVTYYGFDSSDEMIRNVLERAPEMRVLDPWKEENDFDVVITERLIINMPASEQMKTIRWLVQRLKRGGLYIGIENWKIELGNINELRKVLGLPVIIPPTHNVYLAPDILKQPVAKADMESFVPFTGHYYFLSRIVNAYLAALESKEPEYDSEVNRMALKFDWRNVPGLLHFSQGAAMIWRKR